MIEVRDLRRSLGRTEVLRGVTFTARAGQTTAFLGPNGAGKTTTMRVLATLLRPHSGVVRVAGHDVGSDGHEVRRSIGLVTEEPSLLDRFTVREQMEFAARAHRLSRAATAHRIDTLVEMLGFGGYVDERAGRLSKGNRQKASLARALVHDPPVLLLDEPTANLDLVAQAAIGDLLLRPEVRAAKTVLLSTHVIEEAERLCDHVVVLKDGVVISDAGRDEIAASAASFRDAILDRFDPSHQFAPEPA